MKQANMEKTRTENTMAEIMEDQKTMEYGKDVRQKAWKAENMEDKKDSRWGKWGMGQKEDRIHEKLERKTRKNQNRTHNNGKVKDEVTMIKKRSQKKQR